MKILDKKARALIDEGAEISKRMKADKKRLDEIKAILKGYELTEGIHVGNKGGGVIVGYKESWEPPTPRELWDYMKSQKKTALFFDCVKVLTEEAVKAIGKENYNDLRIRNADIPSFSFK